MYTVTTLALKHTVGTINYLKPSYDVVVFILERSSAEFVIVAAWVAAAPANDAPAVFNLWHLFVCFVNEYASWKDLLVPVCPHYRGPFIQLDCGCSGTRSCRPRSRRCLATLAPAHDHSLLSANQSDMMWCNSKPRWHHNSKMSSALYQYFWKMENSNSRWTT